MKLLIATAVAGALLAGLFLVPVSGRTLWQRAESRGLPQSAARAMSSGAHAAMRWAQSKQAAHSESKPNAPDGMPGHRAAPVRGEPAAAHPHPNDVATAQYSQAHYRNAPTPAPAPAARDHIVAAPPAEQLTSSDKQNLDQLIAHSHH